MELYNEGFRWLACDAHGELYAYPSFPSLVCGIWVAQTGEIAKRIDNIYTITHAEGPLEIERLLKKARRKPMTNGSHNVNVTNGNRNVAIGDRVENDFYATPPEAVEALLKHVKFTRTILEPHVGAGHIAKVLKANGYDVVGTDIVDRGYPHTNIKDFFSFTGELRGDIVMNPPYDNAKEHV